jgi:putative endopeptidase
LADKSEARVKKIIEELAARAPDADTLEGKVATFYTAYLDSDGIEKRGLAPVQSYLKQIQEIENRTDLAQAFGTLGFASPLGGWVDIDSKDTENYIFYITQSGLGLPDRDIYLSDDGENEVTREGYLKYLTVLLAAAGYAEPDIIAARVLALETDIARAHWDRAVGRNRNLTYNKITRDELLELGGGFPLEPMLQKWQLAGQAEFVVRELNPSDAKIAELELGEEQVKKISGGGVSGLLSLMVSADLADWRAYLAAHFLSDHAAVLPKKIDDASFEFYAKQLRGQEQQRPRWKRAVGGGIVAG